MEKLDKLKPCPFCGKVAFIDEDSHNNWMIFCEGQQDTSCLSIMGVAGKRKTIKMWNRRDGASNKNTSVEKDTARVDVKADVDR